MQHPLIRILPILALAGLGCGSGPEAFCTDNADCDTKLTCFQNRCLLLEPVPAGLHWEVVPQGSPYAQTLPTPQAAQPLPLEVCTPSVEGNTGELGKVRIDVEGEVRGLPGVCAFEQHVVSGEFSIPIAPGQWRLTIHPERGPPIVRRTNIQSCKPFPLGTLAKRQTAKFRFLATMGRENPEFRCGIRAQAFDPSTGDPLSAVVELPLDANHRCSPPPEGWEIEIASPEVGARFALVLETADAAAPVMRRQTFDDLIWKENPPLLELHTESVAAERVEIFLQDSGGLPVAGARIQASWPPEGGEERECLAPRYVPPSDAYGGFSSAPATPTSEPGVYELWLPPGPYQFRAVPPAATHLAATVWQDDVTMVRPGGRNFLPLQLGRKGILEGSVVGPTGDALTDVSVRVVPLGGHQRPTQTRTDGLGHYRLELDPGPYLLLAEPSVGGFPWNWKFLDDWKGSMREDVALTRPRVLAGTLRRSGEGTSRPLAHSLVRVWDVSGPRPVVAGNAVTDEEGRFVIRIRR